MTLFDFIPILEGKYLTYGEYFAFVSSAVAAIFSFIFCFLTLLLRWISTLDIPINNPPKKPPNSEKIVYSSSNNYNSLNENIISQRTKPLEMQLKNVSLENKNINESKNTSCLGKIANVSSWLSVIILSLIPTFCSAFEVIGVFEAICLIFIIIYSKFLLELSYLENSTMKKNDKCSIYFSNLIKKIKKTITKFPAYFFIGTALISAYSIGFPLFGEKTCLCFYNDEIGLYLNFYGSINTKMTRYFQLKEACPPGPPCHIYATLPENSSSSVFINFHTNKQIKEAFIFYSEQNSILTEKNSQQSTLFDINNIEKNGERNVHSVLLNNLKPNTKYIISIYYDGKVQISKVYKTLPDSNIERNIIMINGGDVGNRPAAKIITQMIASFQPDIVLVGGDIAYDNNLPACYYAWDYYLSTYQKMTDTVGYLVPLVLGIGNHDVGMNTMAQRKIDININGPFFFSFFPQHYRTTKDGSKFIDGVPLIEERKSYFYHVFGKIVYISLDSGYLHDFGGNQTVWLDNILSRHDKTLKMANYHTPTYSSCGDKDKDKSHYLEALLFWVPLFDKHKVCSVFENHVHLFKRTKPITGNIYNENGTVYFGDGCWGIDPEITCQLVDIDGIFDVFAKVNHVWVSNVTNNKIIHQAFDVNRTLLDSYEQKIEHFFQ